MSEALGAFGVIGCGEAMATAFWVGGGQNFPRVVVWLNLVLTLSALVWLARDSSEA